MQEGDFELGMSNDLAQAYFNDPVDPEALGIPDYFEVIKKPMDLGTCMAKLRRGEYAKASELLKDVLSISETAAAAAVRAQPLAGARMRFSCFGCFS